MTKLNLNSRFDSVAELGKKYTLVSHGVVTLPDKETPDRDYEVVIAETTTGETVMFSGKAILSGFSRLVKQIGGNPYPVPVRLCVKEATTKDGVTYKVLDEAETVES
ncbi:MAG: hypothetical protein PHQ11_11165 [Paludibacter sp.]|jgi:hypothetical protein|nr:hypothetical protein [Paludibacter sp.]MDD4429231.1 hypothetical protein [Paludibacter sp.]